MVAYPGWERFPSQLPEGEEVEAAPTSSPEKVKTVLRITVEDLDAKPEGFARVARAVLKESGVCLYALMQEHAEELLALPKQRRYDRLEDRVKQAKKANDNDDRAREAS